MAVAKTSDVVFIATEVFLLGGSFISRVSGIVFEGVLGLMRALEFEGAELLINDLPDYLVRSHVL